jgi:hypothetical protein
MALLSAELSGIHTNAATTKYGCRRNNVLRSQGLAG